MGRNGTICVIAAASIAMAVLPATAQVRDAVYRGTMVCDQLPFSLGKSRGAIEVTISGSAVHYSHIVRLRDAAEPTPEQGTGTLNGDNISLQGSWKGGNRQYEANTAVLSCAVTSTLTGRRHGMTAGRLLLAPVPGRSSGPSRFSCHGIDRK
jgi:hypothetical protein